MITPLLLQLVLTPRLLHLSIWALIATYFHVLTVKLKLPHLQEAFARHLLGLQACSQLVLGPLYDTKVWLRNFALLVKV